MQKFIYCSALQNSKTKNYFTGNFENKFPFQRQRSKTPLITHKNPFHQINIIVKLCILLPNVNLFHII